MQRLSSLFLLLTGLNFVPLAAAPLYTVTNLGTLSGTSYSSASGLNNSGRW